MASAGRALERQAVDTGRRRTAANTCSTPSALCPVTECYAVTPLQPPAGPRRGGAGRV
jgi:hypothetical protein